LISFAARDISKPTISATDKQISSSSMIRMQRALPPATPPNYLLFLIKIQNFHKATRAATANANTRGRTKTHQKRVYSPQHKNSTVFLANVRKNASRFCVFCARQRKRGQRKSPTLLPNGRKYGMIDKNKR
jgi:hypothetical protein